MLNDNAGQAVKVGIDMSPSIPLNSLNNNDIDNQAKDTKPFMMHNPNSNEILQQQQFPIGLEVENLVLDPKPNQPPIRPFYGQMMPPQQQYLPFMINPNQAQQPNLNSQFNPNEMIVPGIVVLSGDVPNYGDQQNPQRAAQLGLLNITGNEQIRLTLMERIRKNAKWFAGCNACFTILLVISLLNKISLYSQKDTSNSSNNYRNSMSSNYYYGDSNSLIKASAVISVIEYIIWFLWIVAAIHGLTSNRLHLLGYFVKGILGCACMEILANVLLFAGFGDWSASAKVTFVIVFLLTLLIQYSFVKNARQILRDIQVFKDKFGGNPLQVGNQNYHNNNNANLENNNLYMQNAQFQPQNPNFMNNNNINLINNNNQNNRQFVYAIPQNNSNNINRNVPPALLPLR